MLLLVMICATAVTAAAMSLFCCLLVFTRAKWEIYWEKWDGWGMNHGDEKNMFIIYGFTQRFVQVEEKKSENIK